MHPRFIPVQVEGKSLVQLMVMQNKLRRIKCSSLYTLEEAFAYLSNLDKINNAIQKLENPDCKQPKQTEQKEFSNPVPERYERAEKIKDSLELINQGLHGLRDKTALSDNGEVLLDDIDSLMELYQIGVPSKIISARLTDYMITDETKEALTVLGNFKRHVLTTQLSFCVEVAYKEAKAALMSVPDYDNKEKDAARLENIHSDCSISAMLPSADDKTSAALTELFEFIDSNRRILQDQADALALRNSKAALMQNNPRPHSDNPSHKKHRNLGMGFC